MDFTETTAPMADYPGVADRRTAGRGTDYPVAAALRAGTYGPPAPPEPEREPETDTQPPTQPPESGLPS